MFLERVVKGEQTREVFGVGDEGCPHLCVSVFLMEGEVEFRTFLGIFDFHHGGNV